METLSCYKHRKVFLFKNRNDDESQCDQYELEFKKFFIEISYIPTLEFELCNQESLLDSLCSLNDFSAIVFTSQRSIEAVHDCLMKADEIIRAKVLSFIANIIVFVVGPATYSKCKQLLNIEGVGKECGNANMLIPCISDAIKPSSNKSVFFPCGDKRLGAITNELPKHGFKVKELTVYRSIQSSKLKSELLHNMELVDISSVVLVFFSPSGMKYVLDILTECNVSINKLSCVAIGPSTAKAIKDEGLTLCGTAKNPNAHSLVDVIRHIYYLAHLV